MRTTTENLESFDTNYDFVKILNTKYKITSKTAVVNLDTGSEVEFFQFNWDNIPEIEYFN